MSVKGAAGTGAQRWGGLPPSREEAGAKGHVSKWGLLCSDSWRPCAATVNRAMADPDREHSTEDSEPQWAAPPWTGASECADLETSPWRAPEQEETAGQAKGRPAVATTWKSLIVGERQRPSCGWCLTEAGLARD